MPALVALIVFATRPVGSWHAVGGSPPDQIVAPSSSLGPVLFQDALTEGFAFENQNCRGVNGDGGLIFSDSDPQNGCYFLVSSTSGFSGDVRIELTARLRQGPEDGNFGLRYGMSADLLNGYALTVQGNGSYRLDRKVNGTWQSQIDTTKDAAVKPGLGSTNRLAVEIRGKAIQAIVNGKIVANLDATETISGQIGLDVGTPGLEVVFSDLRVVSLVPPAPAPAANVVPTPGGSIIVDDDLSTNPKYPIDTGPYCNRSYSEGGYSVENVNPSGSTCEFSLEDLGDHPANARIEVLMRPVKGLAPAGLKFGRKSATNTLYYTFLLGAAGGSTLTVCRNGVSQRLFQGTASAARWGLGQTNHLAVEISVRKLRGFVNGAFLFDVDAPDDVQGYMGLLVEKPGTRVVYTNLKIVDLSNTPGPGRVASPGQRILLGRGERADTAGQESITQARPQPFAGSDRRPPE